MVPKFSPNILHELLGKKRPPEVQEEPAYSELLLSDFDSNTSPDPLNALDIPDFVPPGPIDHYPNPDTRLTTNDLLEEESKPAMVIIHDERKGRKIKPASKVDKDFLPQKNSFLAAISGINGIPLETEIFNFDSEF